ncbi:type-F conjugative transfer system pilin assembly protein TrbC [Vibrio apostichopi]|uniref:type-F conjugative transfer system pilin assembly protein TrbC n=1 Tax=Vibrio apostichopi TaxID=3035453 RepID=UPI0025722598|nr:type-F conjugative transfer system pilin assembly protein TrbC [Vibrio sp. FE10]
MSPFFPVLAMVALFVTTSSHAYTQEELEAFRELEASMLEAPVSEDVVRTVESQYEASSEYSSKAKEMALFWQEKLRPQHLERVIDIPEPKQNPNAAPTGVMVFVSLTMPDATLRALLKQSAQWQVPLVIRGVLPGGFLETAKRIQSLLKTQTPGEPIQSGFAINPEWFRTFEVTEVPTFVAVKPGRCLPKHPCLDTDFDRLTGNVSLPDALNLLAEGDNPEVVNPLLRKGYE